MAWSPDSRFLIVPGLGDSGTHHWQSHWQQQLGCSRVNQDDWRVADLARWSDRVTAALGRDPRPAILIAHSFGCLATMQAISASRLPVAGALLVAPADPDKFSVSPRVSSVGFDIPTILVASRNDPWLAFDKALALARHWGSDVVDLGMAGHINDKSGHGPWHEGLKLLDRLHRRTPVAAARQAPPRTLPRIAPTLVGYAW